MNAPDPYVPPATPIRDAAPSKRERRVLRGLFKLVDDEPRRAARNRFFRWTFALLGGASIALALTSGAADTFWIALLGAAGGYLLGFSALLANSNRNWPIIRRYLDAERIRADYAALRD